MSDETTNTDPVSNNDANIQFPTPVTTVSDVASSETSNIEFEKYKMKLNLFKWLIGTVGIAIITLIINWGFKDRAVGMDEISQYDRYATDLMVLNENPVKKRMLAQFFSTTTPSWLLKNRWEDYYDKVDIEYKDYNHKKDSLKKLRDSFYLIGVSHLNEFQKHKLDEIETILDLKTKEENASMKTPETVISSALSDQLKTVSEKSIAIDLEKLGFESLVNKNFDKAKVSFDKSYQIYPTLHNVDEIRKLLNSKKNLNSEGWNQIYDTILKKYSWGMPVEIKNILKNRY